MNTEIYREYLNNPAKINKNADFGDLREKYPYFMLGHLFFSLQNKEILPTRLAILHPKRELLAKMLLNGVFETAPKEAYVSENQTVKEKKEKKDIPQTVTVEEKKTVEKITPADTTDAKMAIVQQRLNEIQKEKTPITKKITKKDAQTVTLDDLVEKFTKNPPTISTISDTEYPKINPSDIRKNSLSQKSNVVSETLAEIYVSQKDYDKAIKIYQALGAKYPQKSAKFANIINELKELKEKNK
ncbi:MAG: hypothetical protein LBR36_09935 [Bacteroidales bacterium]|jgi:hypothetical protein|nr:hypothetical protein [Bacteroidales bacterium]